MRLSLVLAMALVLPEDAHCWLHHQHQRSTTRAAAAPAGPLMRPARHLYSSNHEDIDPSLASPPRDVTSSRRSFLATSSVALLGITTWLTPLAARAAETAVAESNTTKDNLDDFAKDLSRWPDSPSPLPTQKRSAQELTADPQPRPTAPSLDQALQQSLKKKQIGPRTHG